MEHFPCHSLFLLGVVMFFEFLCVLSVICALCTPWGWHGNQIKSKNQNHNLLAKYDLKTKCVWWLRCIPFLGDKVKPIATCRGTCIRKIKTSIICVWEGKKLTSVFKSLMKVYLLRMAIRAILASSRANLIPMQLWGPKPNGIWASCGRLTPLSGFSRKSVEDCASHHHQHQRR